MCAAYRMHSCCNPLLHDMQALTASAVSCIDPVVSRLQAASAEVAVVVCSLYMCFAGGCQDTGSVTEQGAKKEKGVTKPPVARRVSGKHTYVRWKWQQGSS